MTPQEIKRLYEIFDAHAGATTDVLANAVFAEFPSLSVDDLIMHLRRNAEQKMAEAAELEQLKAQRSTN